MSYEHQRKSWGILPKGIKLLISFMLAAVLLFEAYTFIVVYTEVNSALPAMFGNFEQVRAPLVDDEQREEFSFCVVGDTQGGQETFEEIFERLKDEPISFMVLLGDCVRKGTEDYHRFLRCEWAKEISLPFPVFYVVGNHDVNRQKFPISRFEEMYGPTIFSFEYQGCLFIVLGVVDKPSMEMSFAFLKSSVSARRHGYRKVFVFLHVPPVRPDFAVRSARNTNEFVTLCNRYCIDYVIAGDYHGYARVKVGNTIYLVTGGGGAGLERGKFGRFHHAIVLTIGPNSVSERIIHVNKMKNIEDRAEELAVAEVYPWMKRHWPVAIFLNAGILGMLFGTFHGLLRNRWRHKIQADNLSK
jgi:hypothetical protein